MKKLYLTKEIDSINLALSQLGIVEKSRKSLFSNKYVWVNYEISKPLSNEDKKHIIHSHIPFAFVVVFLVIAFILATVFLILNFTYLDKDNKLSFFFMLMLPAFISLLIGSALSIIRYFNSIRNLESISYIMSKIKKEEK